MQLSELSILTTEHQVPILIAIATFIVLALGLYIFFKRSTPQDLDASDPGVVRHPHKPSGHDVPVVKESVPEISTQPKPTAVSAAPEPEMEWLARLRSGLKRTREHFAHNIAKIFTGSQLNEDLLEELHELLYRADVGATTATHLTETVKRQFGAQSTPDWESVRTCLQTAIVDIFAEIDHDASRHRDGLRVILVIGVNGVGKTTSIGKLAADFQAQGKKVMLCAADTFRAAAIDQLKVWGERLNVPVIHQQAGADPAAVAYDAVKAASARGMDVLLIDTAGRLHNKKELMGELEKIKRVIGRDLPDAPHDTWLVIDATTGQNAFQQIRAFKELIQVSGLIVTKLDGTAKGGIIIGATQEFRLPIKYVGVGEKASDLKPFNPREFAESVL